MNSFRMMATELFLGALLVFATVIIAKVSRRFAVQTWDEMTGWWKDRTHLRQRRNIDEFLTGLPTGDLGRIAFKCWYEELCDFHERAIRYRFKYDDEETVRRKLEEALKEQHDRVKQSEIALEKMTRQELMAVIQQYVTDWIGGGADPEKKLEEIVSICRVDQWKSDSAPRPNEWRQHVICTLAGKPRSERKG